MINRQIIIFVFLGLIMISCSMNYLDYQQHIESPDGQFNYCLYSDDIGISDPGFKVLKIEKFINPEELKIDWNFKDGVSQKDFNWIADREMLSNYDESSYMCNEPKIELIENRFLVFSRGGYYFALYDLKIDKDTFNNCCPFNEWASQNIWAEKGTNYKGAIPENEKSDYGVWIEKNIHNPIDNYIKANRNK